MLQQLGEGLQRFAKAFGGKKAKEVLAAYNANTITEVAAENQQHLLDYLNTNAPA